jgi:AbiJ N-terminal domain 4
MANIFSRRTAPQRDAFRYDLPSQIRSRLFHSLDQLVMNEGQQSDTQEILHELGDKLVAQYGGLRRPLYEAARVSNHPVIEHFASCDDQHALDFIELWFRCHAYWRTGLENRGVEAVNNIFREEGIGYELTPWINRETDEPVRRFGRRTNGKTYRTQYPEMVRRDTEFVHEEIVKPCFDVLSSKAFTVANEELLKAFAAYRRGEFDDALTSCGSAFESVLKTICDLKRWAYDPAKDTCAKLVQICQDNALFPPFYAEAFKSVGTIRNKLSDAHGRGPKPEYTVEKENVDHLIQMTAAHIVFLSRLVGPL